MNPEAWFALAALVLSLLVTVGGIVAMSIRTTWQMADVKAGIIAAITSHATEDTTEFARVRNEIDATARSFGETVHAAREHLRLEIEMLRTQHTALELFCSQNYVRRSGFYEAMKQVNETILQFRNEIREDLKRVEAKVDTKT